MHHRLTAPTPTLAGLSDVAAVRFLLKGPLHKASFKHKEVKSSGAPGVKNSQADSKETLCALPVFRNVSGISACLPRPAGNPREPQLHLLARDLYHIMSLRPTQL